MKPEEPAAQADRTLEETTALVARLLSEKGLDGPAADGRVASLPDARTVRYYQTLGLVDRPKSVGREARYGRRHVLQLVAVKALQAAGYPLAEVQGRLYGRADVELEAIIDAASADASVRRAAPRAGPTAPGPRPVVWREVTLAPGIRIMVEEGFDAGAAPADLLERFRAALAALGAGPSFESLRAASEVASRQ